ncbi:MULTISPECIES: LysR family transcriptional regulator [Pseudomonas]|uniref:LysR family transcriptional regulator n=1 Tax=Pseudomonas TaxID=286 RepID=UPI0008124521|nr:LysR family transcriptional regulator [Pseudomonas sp. 34 E 7]CRM99972.1 Quorum-sensing regulator protein D [Pseudomonas sp. 34 E 7]
MDIEWYEDFLALADTGKFTAAASMRRSSQSALSRRIQLLETRLGAVLIDRSKNPIRLTVAGRALLPNALELVRLARDCEQSVKILDCPLSFASLHTLACNFFPDWISHAIPPGERVFTRIDTSYRSTDDYYMALLSGRCDFILFYREAESQAYAQREEFETLSLGHDELYWVATPQLAEHCTQSDGPIPWLTYSRSAQLHELSRTQVSRHPQPERLQRVFEATVSEALKSMVANGHGVACMPHTMVAGMIEQGELVRLYPQMEPDHLEVILVRWLGNHNTQAQALWARLAGA